MDAESLAIAVTLHSSKDGQSFQAAEEICMCEKCGHRTILCPHKRPHEQVIKLSPQSTHVKVVHVQPSSRLTLNSKRNSRLSANLENVKFSLLETLISLEEIWDDIGFEDYQKDQRHETVSTHVQELLSQLLAEECDLKAEMVVRVQDYQKEVDQLYNDLHLPPHTPNTDLSLVNLEMKLRNDVNTLNKEKHDRLKWLRRLRAEEHSICEQLVIPQHEINFVGSPTLEQLRELEQNVAMLKSEKNKRSESFADHRREIIALWTKLDIEPSNEFEQNIYKNETSFILSKANLETVSMLNTRLKKEDVELLQQIEEKQKKFKLLWNRLEEQLDKSEKVRIQSVPNENTPKTLKILNTNIYILHELKRCHLQSFIQTIRNELSVLWDKCFFGEEQRRNFQPYFNDDYTEEALVEHEHQLNSMKHFYEDNKELFTLVCRRETIWEEKLKEETNSDNNRFNNRGGALIKALKKKKLIEKQLPKLEKQLTTKINQWELENESVFMYKDSRYLNLIDIQKEEFELQQKMKKDEKQNMKMQGSPVNNNKGVKRKPLMGTFIVNTTPKKFKSQNSINNVPSSNSKVTPSKINVSKYTHSSLQKENQKKCVKRGKIPKMQTQSRTRSMKRRSIKVVGMVPSTEC